MNCDQLQMINDDLRTEIGMLRTGARAVESQMSKLRCVAYLSIMLCDALNQNADVLTIKEAIDFLRKNAKEATDETI